MDYLTRLRWAISGIIRRKEPLMILNYPFLLDSYFKFQILQKYCNTILFGKRATLCLTRNTVPTGTDQRALAAR